MHKFSCNQDTNINPGQPTEFHWTDGDGLKGPTNITCCYDDYSKGPCGTCDSKQACICNPGWQGEPGDPVCREMPSPPSIPSCNNVANLCDPSTYVYDPVGDKCMYRLPDGSKSSVNCDKANSGCLNKQGTPTFCTSCGNKSGLCYDPGRIPIGTCVWGQADGVLACGKNPDDQGMVMIPEEGCACPPPPTCPGKHYKWDGSKIVCAPPGVSAIPHKSVSPVTPKSVVPKTKPPVKPPVKPPPKVNVLAIVLPIVAVLIIGGIIAGYVFYMNKMKGRRRVVPRPRPAGPRPRPSGPRPMNFSRRR